MKYNIKKHQLGGTVLNSRVVSGLKNKDGRIGWDSNFNITQPNKQAVLLPNITVTPSTSNANLQEEVNTWNKKYPQTTSEIPRVATSQGGRMSFTQKPKVIGMSGADPIGQFIVEGAALGKPAQYLLDKGLQATVGSTSGEILKSALSKAKSTYYNKAPWTFKPNPNSYYRAVPKAAIDDALETRVIRHNPGMTEAEKIMTYGTPEQKAKLTLYDKLQISTRVKGNQTYFNKGTPLSETYMGKYGIPVTNYGTHIIEASDKIPFIPIKTKGKLIPEVMENLGKNYNPEIRGMAIPKANVLPEKTIPLNEDVNLYKPDLFRGFKKIKNKNFSIND